MEVGTKGSLSDIAMVRDFLVEHITVILNLFKTP